MSHKIQWTTNAYTDFSQIVNFINEKWGKISAEDFISRVDSVIGFIAVFPQLGKLINSQKQIRALIISRQTTIIYRIKSDIIIVLNLFDNRQDPDKLTVNEDVNIPYENAR